jgi:hypothetical protein
MEYTDLYILGFAVVMLAVATISYQLTPMQVKKKYDLKEIRIIAL